MKTLKTLIKLLKTLVHTVVEALLIRLGLIFCIACIVHLQLMNPEYIDYMVKVLSLV